MSKPKTGRCILSPSLLIPYANETFLQMNGMISVKTCPENHSTWALRHFMISQNRDCNRPFVGVYNSLHDEITFVSLMFLEWHAETQCLGVCVCVCVCGSTVWVLYQPASKEQDVIVVYCITVSYNTSYEGLCDPVVSAANECKISWELCCSCYCSTASGNWVQNLAAKAFPCNTQRESTENWSK